MLTGRQADKLTAEDTESKSQPVRLSACPLSLGLGSAVVGDSDPETEWQETLLKGEFVNAQPRDFILYETIRYDQRIREKEVDAHGSVPLRPFSFLDLHLHLCRLRQSCTYFGRPFPLHEIIAHLRNLKTTLGTEPARIKLDLHIRAGSGFVAPHGCAPSASSLIQTHVIREDLSWPEGGMTVMLSDLRLDPSDFRLYHKTNLRPEKYAELEKARALGCTEVLFLNTRGEICEGALSNIILKIKGEWLTPALQCGLLPGTWRERQLTSGRFREAILTLDDLKRADEIRLGNAVRGEVKVSKIIPLPETK